MNEKMTAIRNALLDAMKVAKDLIDQGYDGAELESIFDDASFGFGGVLFSELFPKKSDEEKKFREDVLQSAREVTDHAHKVLGGEFTPTVTVPTGVWLSACAVACMYRSDHGDERKEETK